MKPLYRRLFILAAAIVVVLGIFAAYHFFTAWQLSGPREFSEARSRGGALSQEIVAISNEITVAVGSLSGGELTRPQASSTIGLVESKVALMRDKALQLAGELETMTRALPEVRSEEARAAAFEAVSLQVELAYNLVEYTDLLTMLAATLRADLERGARNNPEIGELIDSINGRAEVINKLNQAANEANQKFDEVSR